MFSFRVCHQRVHDLRQVTYPFWAFHSPNKRIRDHYSQLTPDSLFLHLSSSSLGLLFLVYSALPTFSFLKSSAQTLDILLVCFLFGFRNTALVYLQHPFVLFPHSLIRRIALAVSHFSLIP